MAEPSPKPAEAKPPGKIASFFNGLLAGPRWLLSRSLPAKAAMVTLVVLFSMTLVAWILWLTDPASVPWRHSMTFGRVMLVLLLLTIIPFVLYHGLRLWLDGENSRFPDIDFAWKAGLSALRQSGIDLNATPLFLVIGSTDDQSERSLLQAAGLSLRVTGAPEGPGAIHWYANPDAIYLFCTDASWTSRLVASEQKRKLDTIAADIGNLEEPSAEVGNLPEPEAGEALALPDMPEQIRLPSPPEGSVRGTIMLNQLDQTALALAAMREQQGGGAMTAPSYGQPQIQPGGGGGTGRGTLMLQGPIVLPGPAAPAQNRVVPAPASSRTARPSRQLSPALLPPQVSAEQTQRLRYVCELLRRARTPLCGANGVLALLPLQMISAGLRQSDELQRATKMDLATIQNGLELRCPVTTLVTGLEQESGFRELVRRVGRDRAQVQRFGHRFDLRSEATTEEVTALCAHVCGAFEDWVYTLFREREALTRPGNTKLYSLLCQVRCNLKSRLADVLSGGVGFERTLETRGQPVLFSGCYVAATGNTEDRQAFVKGVFDKLLEEQEDVEWTDAALRGEQRYRTAAYLGMAVSALIVIVLSAAILMRLFR